MWAVLVVHPYHPYITVFQILIIRLEKERLAKQKREDHIREQKLATERERRQAERAAAEHARQANTPPNDRSSSSRGQVRSRTSNPASRRPASILRSGSSMPSNQDPEEVRRLEREEKKARARARLFDEPVSAHKKAVSGSKATAGHASRITAGGAKGKGRAGVMPSGTSKFGLSSSGSISAKQRIEQEFSRNERKPLNLVKRDRRTIEEVERDMKQKKGQTSTAPLGPEDLFFDPRMAHKRPLQNQSETNRGSGNTLNPPLRSTNAGPTSKRKMSHPMGSGSQTLLASSKKRPRSDISPRLPDEFRRGLAPRGSVSDAQIGRKSRAFQEESMEEDEYDSDDDDDFEEEDNRGRVPNDMRDEIWKIMGKDRKQYASKAAFSDEEGSDDMEVAADEVLEEENRALVFFSYVANHSWLPNG